MNPFLFSTVAQPVSQTARTSILAQRKTIATLALGAVCLMSPVLAQSVDVNRAALEDLRKIQGIGPKTAQQIIDERERGGDYESLEDLSDRVKGIGPKKAARLGAAGLTVGAVSAAVQATAAAAPATEAPQTVPHKPVHAAPASRLSGFFSR